MSPTSCIACKMICNPLAEHCPILTGKHSEGANICRQPSSSHHLKRKCLCDSSNNEMMGTLDSSLRQSMMRGCGCCLWIQSWIPRSFYIVFRTPLIMQLIFVFFSMLPFKPLTLGVACCCCKSSLVLAFLSHSDWGGNFCPHLLLIDQSNMMRY